jgi:hypothetical protein
VAGKLDKLDVFTPALKFYYYNYTLYGEEVQDRRLGAGE